MPTRKSAKPAPEVARKQPRPSATVRSVVLRMGLDYLAELDELCDVNKRSRREIVEILVREAALEVAENPEARIDP